jgi:hypothetical protein
MSSGSGTGGGGDGDGDGDGDVPRSIAPLAGCVCEEKTGEEGR